ncbi:alpha/beta hydrolase [Mesorhizobium sp. M0317]
MTFFLHHGYRVIAHDRRGHGRSDQPSSGNDMDHWVADLAALTEHLNLREAIHVGHSTGGGEVARYVARHRNRSEFFRYVPEHPFYGYTLDGAKPSEAIIANWWRQGMAGGALAHYATVDSWLEDYTEDLKKIAVPVLVMHGEADQVVPFASSVPRAVELLKIGLLKTYPGSPHGMLTTHADVLNPDLLSFIRS